MADTATLDNTTLDPAQTLANEIGKINKSLEGLDTLKSDIADMKSLINEKGKAQPPAGAIDMKKSSPSQAYRFQNMVRGLFERDVQKNANWKKHCSYETDLNMRVSKGLGLTSETMCPISSELLRIDPHSCMKEDGTPSDAPGVSVDVIKEIQQNFGSAPSIDPDELSWLRQRGVLKGMDIQKDPNNYTTVGQGGYLRPLAAQGELIEILRNSLAFARAGVRQFPLPPQGLIRYPRQITANTVDGYSEFGTISETEMTFNTVDLAAQAYSGLSKVTEDLIKYASISVEALIREDLARVSMLKIDRDMFDGAGHGSNEIPGLVGVSGIITRAASTLGANGDTLGTSDISFLIADMDEANAPTDRGVAIITRPGLWTAVTKRKDTLGRYVFDDAARGVGQMPSVDGNPVIKSTNTPNDRAKGAATDLTLVLAIVPSEILLGMAGVMDMAMTNSDSSDFQKRVLAIRSTCWTDMNVRHAASVGLLDDLLAE